MSASLALLVPIDGNWLLTEPARPLQRRAGNLRLVHDCDRDSVSDADTALETEKMSEHPKTTEDVAANATTLLSEDTIRETVAVAIEDLGLPTKQLARSADMTPPAVKSWLERRNTMSLTAAVRLCRQHPRFQSALARLIGIEADVLRAHETQRLLGELHRTAGDFIAELKERGREEKS